MSKDPLASWSDRPAKASILAFVNRVTKKGAADFVSAAERIAVFDNDGTLWPEQPTVIQFAFAFDRVRALSRNTRSGENAPIPRGARRRRGQSGIKCQGNH